VALPTLIDAVAALPAFARVVNTVPVPGTRLTIGGMAGSSDAVVLAALARRLPTRFFVVVTEGVPQAERWLADLQAILDETPVALYPPREGFGEAEPHAEVAGERVETLERVSRGDVRVLLTTARALLERTRLPTTLRSAPGGNRAASGADRIRARADGRGRRAVLGARGDLRHLQLRDGRPRTPRVLGRRDH
jgi:transcription-repair coupling factor (superfamily II helicase)